MSSTLKEVSNPSELYEAIKTAVETSLDEAGSTLPVGGYSDWGPERCAPIQVLIELASMNPGTLRNDGRKAQQFEVVLYAVFSRGEKQAALQAMNLASALARLVDRNRWGFHHTACSQPENIQAEPSFLIESSNKHKGFEAWECRFQQTLYLGANPWADEQVRSMIAIAINPEDPDDDNEYNDLVIDVSADSPDTP